MVDVNITDLGTSTTFDIVATPGGVVGTLAGLGVTSVGPFPGGTPISITLVSSTDPGCTFTLPGSYQDCCNGICTGAVAAVLGVNTTGPINCGGTATNAIGTHAGHECPLVLLHRPRYRISHSEFLPTDQYGGYPGLFP